METWAVMGNPFKQDQLVAATLRVADEIHLVHEQLRQINNNQAILLRLAEMENKIMSAISDFGDRVNARFDELGTAVDGVSADVDFLKAEIKKLQDNPGPITAADQAILDSIQARVDGLVEKVRVLDAATEPIPAP